MMGYLASQFSLAKWIHIYDFVELACNINKKYVKLLVKISHVYSVFKIQVVTTSAIKCWGNFRIFQFASAIHWQKNWQRLSRNLCILCRQWLWHTMTFYQGLWLGFLTVILFTYSIFFVDRLVLVSLCILVIVGEHIQHWKNQVLKI